VFIGIQVSNWNATQAEHARERLLLGGLRAELSESIEQLTKQNAFDQVARSGERSVAFLDARDGCGDIVDALEAIHRPYWEGCVDVAGTESVLTKVK
jgi:hypothetical protein